MLYLIQLLPPMSRSVINLYVIEAYKHKEISQMLGITESTSNWHLMNARNILKKKLINNTVEPQRKLVNE